MPARKMPRSHLHVTGVFASTRPGHYQSSPFESLLERDFLALLDFDVQRVRSYQVQPVTIHYPDPESGKARRYTPDVLVHYRNPEPPDDFVLYEVKARRILRRRFGEYKTRFRAAMQFAREANQSFKIIADVEIRTPRLGNILFLHPLRRRPIDEELSALLTAGIKRRPGITVATLLELFEKGSLRYGRALYATWHLIATGSVLTDLNAPLSMESTLNSREEPAPSVISREARRRISLIL